MDLERAKELLLNSKVDLQSQAEKSEKALEMLRKDVDAANVRTEDLRTKLNTQIENLKQQLVSLTLSKCIELALLSWFIEDLHNEHVLSQTKSEIFRIKIGLHSVTITGPCVVVFLLGFTLDVKDHNVRIGDKVGTFPDPIPPSTSSHFVRFGLAIYCHCHKFLSG